MSLPSAWVEKIFTKCALVYGRAFLDRWAGLDLDAVKADWAHELAGFERHPKAIAWALQNLPAEKPPTALEFRKLGYATPKEDAPQIAYQPADLARVALELEKLASVRDAPKCGMRDWAVRLKEKDATNPKSVTQTVRKMYRQALGEIA